MTYVHFDRNAVAAAMRKAADASYELALAAAPNEVSREYVRVQRRFDAVIAEAIALVIDLKNDCKPEEMVASAFGSAIGAMITNVVGNASDPEKCLLRINQMVALNLKNMTHGSRKGFSSAGPISVPGQLGGRA